MKKSLVIKVLTLFISCFWQTINAQSGVHTTGGNSQSPFGKLSYSVGQTHYLNQVTAGGSLGQGVQHAIEIYRYTVLPEKSNGGLHIQIFPNPTLEGVFLELRSALITNYSYRLISESGILCQEEMLRSNQTFLDMSNMSAGAYFLIISFGKDQVEYKIVKN